MKKQHAEKFLAIIRRELAAQRVGALIVPTSDPHNSEYVADRFQHRAKLSNFYGSAGTAVVTPDEALLWTDGRYWLEAAASLPEGWTLQKAGSAGVPTVEDWLEEQQIKQNFKEKGLVVAIDPYTYSAKAWEALAKKVPLKPSFIAPQAAEELKKSNNDNVAEGSSSSSSPLLSAIIVRLEQFCGETPTEKIAKIVEKVTKLNATSPRPIDAVLLTALDDIAWLTNMRGVDDVPYNPVFISYAIVDVASEALHLFVDYREVDEAGMTVALSSSSSSTSPPTVVRRTSVKEHCAAHNIVLHSYAGIEPFLAAEYIDKGKVIGVEEAQTNYALVTLIEQQKQQQQVTAAAEGGSASGSVAEAKRIPSIVSHLKGVKNSAELKGFEDCHVRDGCALVRFMAWLSNEMKLRKDSSKDSDASSSSSSSLPLLKEADASDKLAAFRAEEVLFRGPSFATISSSGPNGAVIHYHPQRPTDRPLHCDELYLVDSGGQYEDGTTDVTRVLTFSTEHALHAEQVYAYTLVLKGHIALATAVFPAGVAGYRLDSLARQFLWRDGLDYAHGTGHGVGSFLCVHEGPHSVPFRLPAAAVALEKGMILSNEPGFYEDGSYGIRIENLVSVVGADASKMKYPSGKTTAAKNNGTATNSLAFKQLTMAPFNKDLIDVSLLTADEIRFVNAYHAEVRKLLAPLLAEKKDDLALAYLEAHTAPLMVVAA